LKPVRNVGPEIGEQRIGLQTCGEDPLGHDEQPGLAGKPAIEAYLPADLAAARPAVFDRNTVRNRAGGDAARLEQDDRSVRHQRRRHTRRLAGAWRGGDDGRARSAHVLEDQVDVRIDRKRIDRYWPWPQSWRSRASRPQPTRYIWYAAACVL